MDATTAYDLMNKMYWRLRNRRWEIERNERYFKGDQKLTFATDEWLKENGERYASFSDNWTASVVNAIAERIKITGVELRPGAAITQEAAKTGGSKLWDQWLMNEMGAQSSQGFLTTFVARRSYVLVWGDNDGNAQVTWEHPSNVEIQYDWMNPRLRTAALKTWVDDEQEYANLYTTDEVFKWVRSRSIVSNDLYPQSVQMEELGFGTFGPWNKREINGEVWPLPHPFGLVPMVEIPNRPLLRGEPVSEINGVIPLQDGINLLWAYLFFSADQASMPARVLLGATPPMRKILDTDGNVISEQPVTMEELNATRMATFSDPNAKIDQWDAARLDVFTDVIDIAVNHIADQTRTPAYYLSSGKGLSNLSADAMKIAQDGLVQKALEFQTYAEPNVREVFRLIAIATGDQSLANQMRLGTIDWKNPEIRSEAQLTDALVKKRQMGYPLEYLMEVDGIDPYDRGRIEKMIQAENDRAMGYGVQQAVNADQNGPADVPAV